jgi:hypothetical protein
MKLSLCLFLSLFAVNGFAASSFVNCMGGKGELIYRGIMANTTVTEISSGLVRVSGVKKIEPQNYVAPIRILESVMLQNSVPRHFSSCREISGRILIKVLGEISERTQLYCASAEITEVPNNFNDVVVLSKFTSNPQCAIALSSDSFQKFRGLIGTFWPLSAKMNIDH